MNATERNEVISRRFGPGHEKPCRRPEVITCAGWDCQKAGECQHPQQPDWTPCERTVRLCIEKLPMNTDGMHFDVLDYYGMAVDTLESLLPKQPDPAEELVREWDGTIAFVRLASSNVRGPAVSSRNASIPLAPRADRENMVTNLLAASELAVVEECEQR